MGQKIRSYPADCSGPETVILDAHVIRDHAAGLRLLPSGLAAHRRLDFNLGRLLDRAFHERPEKLMKVWFFDVQREVSEACHM